MPAFLQRVLRTAIDMFAIIRAERADLMILGAFAVIIAMMADRAIVGGINLLWPDLAAALMVWNVINAHYRALHREGQVSRGFRQPSWSIRRAWAHHSWPPGTQGWQPRVPPPT